MKSKTVLRNSEIHEVLLNVISKNQPDRLNQFVWPSFRAQTCEQSITDLSLNLVQFVENFAPLISEKKAAESYKKIAIRDVAVVVVVVQRLNVPLNTL